MTLRSQRKSAKRMYEIIKFRKVIVPDLDLILQILNRDLGQRRNKRSVIQGHLIEIEAGKYNQNSDQSHIRKINTEIKDETINTDHKEIVINVIIDIEGKIEEEI